MKIIALSISLCVLSQAAVAQTPECRFMPNPTARLACYDKASVVEKSTARTSASKSSKADPPKYVDAIGAEDAQMNARLKNICRGC
jgi:hypothetical protein